MIRMQNTMKLRVMIPVCMSMTGVCAPLYAQQTTQSVSTEEVEAQAARAELEARYEDALKLYERAYLLDADGYYIYKRAMVYEAMGQPERALELLREQREEVAQSRRVIDLPLSIERLEKEVAARDDERPGGAKERPSRAPAWALIGAGSALTIGGVALWFVGREQALDLACSPDSAGASDARCAGRQKTRYDRASWEDAWEKASRRQVGGVTTASLGGAALVGGAVWLFSLRGEGSQVSNARLQLAPEVSSGRVGVTWTIMF